MSKKSTISKSTNKVLLSLVYFLFFTVQLHFQYQSASSVDFIDNTIKVQHTNLQLCAKSTVIQQDASFVKHNRLNKRYHPEGPIAILDFFEYQPTIYPAVAKQYLHATCFGNNVFLSTYLLRGPPANV